MFPTFAHADLEAVYSPAGRLQGMLDFEAALARAQARAGVLVEAHAEAIADCCRADSFDASRLEDEARTAGNLAIPLVAALTARVAADYGDAARFVHWGATSQDAIDTGAILQLRAALAIMDADAVRLETALADLADRYRDSPQAGRTLMQHALPVTFGLKAAHWLDAVTRHRARQSASVGRILALQFGGAAGTLASLGARGPEIARALADILGLDMPPLAWHTERDRFAEAACQAGLLVGLMGKIARDLSLMAQTEIGEVAEASAPGRGGSSTLPHKRNPVGCAAVIAAATRAPGLVSTMLGAMVQEHERGLGNWQAEWTVLPELVTLAGGALRTLTDVVSRLEVDEEAMRRNLDATRGLVMAEAVSMALGVHVGKARAHALVEGACRRALAEGLSLRRVLGEDSEIVALLDAPALDRLMEPRGYLGAAGVFVDRAIAGAREARRERD